MGYFYNVGHFKKEWVGCINIYGPRKTGKSTFLAGLAKLFEEEQVIWLDFSDFAETTYVAAIKYVGKKMSELYWRLFDACSERLEFYFYCEEYLNVLEGVCSEGELANSLLNMVRNLRYCQRRLEVRPIIFIDEASRPLLCAAEHGYLTEMYHFMDLYLDIDHYELTKGIIVTSYAPLNTDVSFQLNHITDVPINDVEPLAEYCLRNGIVLNMDFRQDRYSRMDGYFDTKKDLKSCYDSYLSETEEEIISGESIDVVLSNEMVSVIADKRKWIENIKKEALEQERRRKESEKREYAEPLSDATVIPSKFAGARSLSIETGDKNKHAILNERLKELWRQCKGKITLSMVYNNLQHVREENVPGINEMLTRMERFAELQEGNYRTRIYSNDQYWVRFDVQRHESEPGYGDYSLVKAYLSVDDVKKVTPFFEDIVRYLTQNGLHRFHAKVAKLNRYDQMSFWVSREDFFLFEKYIQRYYKEDLITPLSFVAYRGKIGISREFYSWESHNSVQAGLIATYLNGVGELEKIEVLDMYKKYVKAWNGDLDEDHPFTAEFKRSNAQELLVLLETLDVLLGNAEVGNECLLLNGDTDLWHILGKAKSWHDINVAQEILNK